MTPALPPYPAYKETGIPWLPRIPKHWGVRKLRHILREVTERNRPDLPLLSVVREKGVVLRDITNKDENHNYIPDDLSNYKVVRYGQFAINKMKAWQGSYGVSKYDGIVSPAYFVFDINGVIRRYFHVAIRSKAYVPFFNQASDGVRIGQWDLAKTRMREIPFCVPPESEQRAIADYIDRADARIRRAIELRQRQVELLEEYKRALIQQAVTGQIDVRTGEPYPAYKDSGVPWLGKVPEGWEVRRLKDVAEVQTGITLGKDYRNKITESYPYIRVANVQQGHLNLETVKTVEVPPAEASRSMLRDGDVLMTEGGDIDKLGRGCIWRGEIAHCLHQNHIFAVRCDSNKMLPETLVGLMMSEVGRIYFQRTAKQTTNLASTNRTTLRSFLFPLAPIGKQKEILQYLDRQNEYFDSAILIAQRGIELLKEYRTRLIADVVTGQVDVREVGRVKG